jgi:hypothetical protein
MVGDLSRFLACGASGPEPLSPRQLASRETEQSRAHPSIRATRASIRRRSIRRLLSQMTIIARGDGQQLYDSVCATESAGWGTSISLASDRRTLAVPADDRGDERSLRRVLPRAAGAGEDPVKTCVGRRARLSRRLSRAAGEDLRWQAKTRQGLRARRVLPRAAGAGICPVRPA